MCNYATRPIRLRIVRSPFTSSSGACSLLEQRRRPGEPPLVERCDDLEAIDGHERFGELPESACASYVQLHGDGKVPSMPSLMR